jgi:hypothetical protein
MQDSQQRGSGTNRYVIAAKRDMRTAAPADWQKQIENVPGLSIVGDSSLQTVTVEATDAAIAYLKQQWGDYLYIEPAIDHRPYG